MVSKRGVRKGVTVVQVAGSARKRQRTPIKNVLKAELNRNTNQLICFTRAYVPEYYLLLAAPKHGSGSGREARRCR
jgi:hypothetical protein